MLQKLKNIQRQDFDTERNTEFERVALSQDLRGDGQTLGGGEIYSQHTSLNERKEGKVLVAVENKMERNSAFRAHMKKERSEIRVHSTKGQRDIIIRGSRGPISTVASNH